MRRRNLPNVKISERGLLWGIRHFGQKSMMQKYGTEYFPLTVEAHLELMRQCGFQTVEVIWMSYMQAGFMGVKL